MRYNIIREICRRNIMVNISASQAEDAGSIPVVCSCGKAAYIRSNNVYMRLSYILKGKIIRRDIFYIFIDIKSRSSSKEKLQSSKKRSSKICMQRAYFLSISSSQENGSSNFAVYIWLNTKKFLTFPGQISFTNATG